MDKKQMQESLLKLAFEMTASLSTANSCIADMDLENDEELRNISDYLKTLIYKEQGLIK